MGFVVFITIAIGMYIWSFKEDFETEKLEIAIPFIVIVIVLLIIANAM